jgi:hypothetical protein
MFVTGSAAAAAQAAIGNVAEHIKAVPDQVNSLLSKYAPGLAEADMKQCNLDISFSFDVDVD